MKKIMQLAWSFAAIIICSASVVYGTTNEITVTCNLRVKKNSAEITKTSGNQLIQMAGTKFFSTVYTATSTNQPVSKGNVDNLGWCYMRNLSTNNSVYISFDVGATTNMMLKFAEAALFRLNTSFEMTNVHIRTTSGVCDMELTIVEN
jgi:hypothetical protein